MPTTTAPQPTRDNLAAWLAWQAAALARLDGREAANDQSFAAQDADRQAGKELE